MKKIGLLAGALALVASAAMAIELTPLQIGLAGTKAQLFPATTRVMGLRLNLVCSDNEDVTGFDVGVVGLGQRMNALQLNLVNRVEAEFSGVSVGLFGELGSLAGIQVGLFNSVGNDMSGWQVGLFNTADSVTGLQVGLINRAVTLRGLQVGLINLVEEGPLTFFPILNFAF